MMRRIISSSLLGSLLALLSSTAIAEPLAENQARFGVITGDVGLLVQGAREWIEPHEGLPIEPGDQIRTGEDGDAEILLSQNVAWWVQPETDLVAEHMEMNAGRLSLASGVLMGKVDSAHTGAVQHWEFNTPAAVCAVRGTEFALNVIPGEGTHLAVFEGEVGMQPAEGPSGEAAAARIGAHQEGVVQKGKPLKTLAAFSLPMQSLEGKRPELRTRFARMQGTWSPFTISVRQTARSKFVKPIPKPSHRSTPVRRHGPQRF